MQMTFQKKTALILVFANFMLLPASRAWAQKSWDATVSCSFEVSDDTYNAASKFPGFKSLMDQLRALRVSSVVMDSATNKVTLKMKNGVVETLDPMTATGRGLFGEHNFDSRISNRNGKIFVESPTIGKIYIKHFCGLGDIPFERCVSQGTGHQAEHSLVSMNIEGQVIHLNEIGGTEKDGFFDFTCVRTAN